MDRKSTSGSDQILGGKLVCWSAKKQQSAAMSSAEAEYVAAAGCCASILWMKSQLSDYDIHYKMVHIFCDNTNAIAISNNPVLHSRTKHIDIRYHFIRDHIVKGDIELHFIPIKYQLADIFTEPLDELTFYFFTTEEKHEEFWCTAIAYDPNPPVDETQSRPLKEYLIKFSLTNGKKPLTLDFKPSLHPLVLITTMSPEVSGALSKKRQNPKSNKTPTETQATLPTGPTEGSKQSHSVSSGNVLDPQDSERNIQLAGTRLPSTSLDEGIRKSQPFPEGTTTDPKDSGGNVQPTDKGLPSTNSDEDLLLSDDEMVQASDDEEVFAAGEEMDDDFPPTNEESKRLVKYLRKVSRVLFNRITEEQWAQHEEAVVSYANLKASIKGYYEENVDHRDQTDKLKVLEATEAYTANPYNITKLLSLAKTFDFSGLKFLVETVKAALDAQNDHFETWADLSSLKSDTSEIKSMMTEIYQAFKGQSLTPSSSMPQITLAITEGPANVGVENVTPVVTEEPPSHTEGETKDMKTQDTNEDKVEKDQIEGKGIATDEQLESTTKKLVLASKVVREDPDEPIKVPYMINGKMHYLTNDEINDHLEKEDKIKKVAEKAKRFEMTKTEVIKIVQEEAEKIRIDPKKVISAKAGEKFEKAQDPEMQWTISSRPKPEPITDVKIHRNSKPAVLTIYRNNDKRHFVVHNPFKFGDFGLTEYERLKKIPGELGIQYALPAPVSKQAPSQSSRRKRNHMELEPKIKNDIHKVRVDSLVSYLVMASMIKTLENARFYLKLKKLIAEHSDQEKLQSKKVKLESVGYKLD
ncbi:hypothetical protein Tco_0492815 [Tanacetum coccineum]